MASDKTDKTIEDIFSAGELIISYAPLGDEPDPFSCPLIAKIPFPLRVTVPQSKTVDPEGYALFLNQTYADKQAFVLIPGRAFDVLGSRKGRGGGWYDRFLAGLPKSWVRVGIANSDRISPDVLPRQPWDVLMDWLLVREENAWRAVACLNNR